MMVNAKPAIGETWHLGGGLVVVRAITDSTIRYTAPDGAKPGSSSRSWWQKAAQAGRIRLASNAD